MCWIALIVGVAVCVLVSNVISYQTGAAARHKEQAEYYRTEMRYLEKSLKDARAREVAEMNRKHDSELNGLRYRCAKYAEALVTADQEAGRLPRDGFSLNLAIESVPLKVEKKA